VVKALKKLLHNKNQPLQQSLEVVPTFKIAFCFSGQLIPIIFWNMSPLHTAPFDMFLWYLGIKLFEELENAH